MDRSHYILLGLILVQRVISPLKVLPVPMPQARKVSGQSVLSAQMGCGKIPPVLVVRRSMKPFAEENPRFLQNSFPGFYLRYCWVSKLFDRNAVGHSGK